MNGFKKGHKPYVHGGKREGSGRKKNEVVREIKSLAQSYDAEALERLAYWMRSDNATASVSACNALLDRGHGKAQQNVEHSGKVEQTIPDEDKDFIRKSIQEFMCKR